MGEKVIRREVPGTATQANGFHIRIIGIVSNDGVTYQTEIFRSTPMYIGSPSLKTFEGPCYPLLVMEAIEWTFEYSQGSKNEDNKRSNRYSKRIFPQIG